MLHQAVLCTNRYIAVFTLCAVLALCIFITGAKASDESNLDDFALKTESHDTGTLVHVEYDHPIWGWVDAGAVEFLHGGRILLTIRGEETREVSDLREALAAFAVQREASPALGRRLAMRIEQHAGN
ncbi:hypothetical protein DPQ33_01105 [Oceanidesulfovibrio indonesiensis]|uniref:Uncharacterized protein n=1 Tax=Oceanidesulfovibrio indonesiensis TaxID=54767 RepID=A0A7M3MKA8_9BACT|nr:hypothetical protein [Oceanidesulfovibrio indonesiensis]TVM19861.1 hypothetical protein DPQ33_01105 [Oceanidesulfovibrio indonesiensis]